MYCTVQSGYLDKGAAALQKTAASPVHSDVVLTIEITFNIRLLDCSRVLDLYNIKKEIK